MTIAKFSSSLLLCIIFLIIARFQYLYYVNEHAIIQATGLAILHSGLIFLYYLLGKFVVEDGKRRTQAKVFWFISDKVVLTLSVIYLAFHHDVSGYSGAGSFWFLLLVLLDMMGTIGKTISESKTITSGYFLRGMVVGEKKSVVDYLVVIMVLTFLFLMLLKH